MMLIGQYDSPFVRRVAVTLKTYGLPYEHAPWSTFGDAAKIAAHNPLIRVPTLVLDDGVAIMDSAAILEVLDDLVGPQRAVLNRSGADRRELLRLCALAGGTADKAVSLLYERVLREAAFPLWVDRCRTQVGGGLDALETARAARTTAWLFDDAPSHADVLMGTMWAFIGEGLSGEFDMARWPALQAHSARCEALAPFAEAYQPYRLTPPPGG